MSEMKRIVPDEILRAVSNLLSPYGVDVSESLKKGKNPIHWETIAEAHERTSISKQSLYLLAKRGDIRISRTAPSKRGGKILFDSESLDDYLVSNIHVEA